MTHAIARRGALRLSIAASAATALPALVRAQEPVDSLKILVGFPPGGTADVAARQIAEKRAARERARALLPPIQIGSGRCTGAGASVTPSTT